MFGPEHTFSATKLEQYASCPFRFFMEQVLKLKPVEELALQVDFLQRGRLAHEVLASFHRRVNQELGRPASPSELDGEQFDRLMDEVLDERFGSELADPVEGALLEVDRRLLTRWMSDYCDQHKRYDELWRKQDVALRPEFFEVSFGLHDDDESSPSTDRPLEFTAEGQTVRISGRIDRIDTGSAVGSTVFNVIDYKTGKARKVTLEGVAAGTMLQLPVYAMAVADLLLKDRGAVPWQAGYWSVRDKGFSSRAALQMHKPAGDTLVSQPEWEEIRSTLPKTVVALVRGIRGGRFPVCSADENCTGYCPFSTVCRINQVRSLEKIWQP